MIAPSILSIDVDDRWIDDEWVILSRDSPSLGLPPTFKSVNYRIVRSYCNWTIALVSSKYTRVGKIQDHYSQYSFGSQQLTCRPYWRSPSCIKFNFSQTPNQNGGTSSNLPPITTEKRTATTAELHVANGMVQWECIVQYGFVVGVERVLWAVRTKLSFPMHTQYYFWYDQRSSYFANAVSIANVQNKPRAGMGLLQVLKE